jgi:hypothetical protein
MRNRMLATGRSARAAGEAAGQRFKRLAKAWRRALRPVFLACCGLVITFGVAGILIAGQAKFWLGALAGATMALYMALATTPPALVTLSRHIPNHDTDQCTDRAELRVIELRRNHPRWGPRRLAYELAQVMPVLAVVGQFGLDRGSPFGGSV